MTFSGGATDVASGTVVADSIPFVLSPAINVGDLVIISPEMDGVTSIDGVTDSLGNTYLSAHASVAWGGGLVRLFYSIATVGGSTPTVTVAITGTTTAYYVGYSRYISSTGSITLVDASGAAGTTASPMDSGSAVVGATSMLYGRNSWVTTQPAQPAGWTEREATFGLIADVLAPGAGTFSYQPTFTGTQDWVSFILGFEDAAAAAGSAGTLIGGNRLLGAPRLLGD